MSAGSLHESTIWAELRVACETLADTPPDLIASMTVSAPASGCGAGTDYSILRFAQEHRLQVKVERRPGRIIVRLTRG